MRHIFIYLRGQVVCVDLSEGRLRWLPATGTSGFGYGSGRLILGFSAGVTSVSYKHKKVCNFFKHFHNNFSALGCF